MNKVMSTVSWAVCAILVFLYPFSSVAFEAFKYGEDSEVTVYGFLRNNTGIFTQTQPYAGSGNQLATERTMLRTNLDWKMNTNFSFFLGTQFAYEPQYSNEQGAASSHYTLEPRPIAGNGREYSEYNNVNDVLRESYVQWKPDTGNTIKIGRQIAIWGEALTDRVGDVVQPNDNRWGFAFANLEDTRIPEWMIRGFHDLGVGNTNFEWIIDPLLTDGPYRVNMNGVYYDQWGNGAASQRFAINPEDRVSFPLSIGTAPYSVTTSPVSQTLVGVNGMPFGIPSVRVRYPDSWSDTRYGFRTTTTADGFTFGPMYWHTQNYDPLLQKGAYYTVNGTPYWNWTLAYKNYDIFGFYVNKQLPWPGVVRSEAIYSPNKPFNTFNFDSSSDAIVTRDYVKYMIAYDLNSFLYFPWHKTAPIDITFEHVGEWVPDARDLQWIGGVYNTKQPTWIRTFTTRISTNWFYNKVSTEIVFSYNTFGNSGLVMPAVTWTAPWHNDALSFQLKYIDIYAGSNYEGFGVYKGKNLALLTAQYNF